MNHERLELRLKEHTNGFTIQRELNFVYLNDEITETRLEALEIMKTWIDNELSEERRRSYHESNKSI